jgi:hypothetical protein
MAALDPGATTVDTPELRSGKPPARAGVALVVARAVSKR